MSDYDSIRPYNDDEVPEVLRRIIEHPDLAQAAAKLVMPNELQRTLLGSWATRMILRRKTKGLKTVRACQDVIAHYFNKLIQETSMGVTVSGLDNLDPNRRYLFTSNHRDIVLDSGLLNYYIHQAGHETCRMAVGDNLLTHELAADLMKLNKSFVVERGARGTRQGYRILTRTSQYIRHSLREGVSVWIAQREGRAKDGWDRTDPALLKMLALAYRDADDSLNTMVAESNIVPVAISYELDPCAVAKARELHIVATEGSYAKSMEEDVESIITGLIGQKGRIHLNIGEPIHGEFGSPQELSDHIDRGVVGGLRVFPTHVRAAELMEDTDLERSIVAPEERAMQIFSGELEDLPQEHRDNWLVQYANVIRNRRDLQVA